MDKWFHPTQYNGCNYLSMLRLKLIHVSKRGLVPQEEPMTQTDYNTDLTHWALIQTKFPQFCKQHFKDIIWKSSFVFKFKLYWRNTKDQTQSHTVDMTSFSTVNCVTTHQTRTAQFSFRPGDYLPLHFGLNFRNPCYIYIRACCIIYICSLYHSVHKFTINNPNLCIIGLEIFNWKYWFDNLSGHLLRPSED